MSKGIITACIAKREILLLLLLIIILACCFTKCHENKNKNKKNFAITKNWELANDLSEAKIFAFDNQFFFFFFIISFSSFSSSHLFTSKSNLTGISEMQKSFSEFQNFETDNFFSLGLNDFKF